jgi:16S rRNA processing protein RimM
VRGELAVEVLTDVADRLGPGSRLLACEPGGGRRFLTVASCRAHRGGVLLGFAEIPDRTAAQVLRGATLEVERSEVPQAPAGSYYHYELLGCRVEDRRAGELGVVVDLAEDGGGLLLLVDGGRGVVPVPFVERFVRSVDVAGGRIELELPEGLVEACAVT